MSSDTRTIRVIADGVAPEVERGTITAGQTGEVSAERAEQLVEVRGVAEYVEDREPRNLTNNLLMEVDGIGEDTARDILHWCAEREATTVEALLDEDLTELPGVGPELAEALRQRLERA